MIEFDVKIHGVRGVLSKFSPSRMRRVRSDAIGLATRHMLKQIRAESRVGDGRGYVSEDYKGSWRVVRSSDASRSIVNAVSYAPYVTGIRQTTTFRGRRKGAGAFFMRKVRREHWPAARRIMLERIRKEFA